MSLRPVIFISAVSKELKTARQLVANALTFLGYEPEWQDVFGTEEGDLRSMLRRRIDGSRGVVQLVGKCYGVDLPQPDEQFGRVSYTQYEALYAKGHGKKVWYLFLDETFPVDLHEPESEERRALQSSYRETLRSDAHLYHPLGSTEALEASVLKLREELTRLRRGTKQWAGFVAVLLLLIAGAVMWIIAHQNRQIAVIQKQGEQVNALVEHNQKMEQALVHLAEVEMQSKQGAKKLSPEEQRARAYTTLETELGLAPGTLARELPGFALELYNRTDTSTLMRARAAYALNKFDEAERLSLEAAQRDQKAYETAEQVADERRKSALEAYELAGQSAQKRILFNEALAYLRKAEQLTDRAHRAIEWARVEFAIGSVIFDQGQYGEAERVLRQALEVRLQVLGPDHPDTLLARNTLAHAVVAEGKYHEAEEEYRTVMELRAKMLGPESPGTLGARMNLANVLYYQGRYPEAEREYRAVLKQQEKVLGPQHHETLLTRLGLALALAEQGKYSDAEAEYRAVIQSREKLNGPEHPQTLMARGYLALTLESQGKYGDAETELRSVLTLTEKALGPEHPETLRMHNNLAWCLVESGKYQQAEDEVRSTIKIQERVLGPDNPSTLNSKDTLAEALRSEGKLQEAEVELRQLMLKYEAALGPKHALFLNCTYHLARCLSDEKKTTDAKDFAKRAADGARKVLGPEHPDTKKYEQLWEELQRADATR